MTVIVGVGLNVLFGLSGQVSFGHVGFYALGAYTAAILTTAAGWSFWLTLPVTAVLTGTVGWLLGLTEALITSYAGSSYTNIVTFTLVIVALAAKPQGLFGQAAVKKV